uniref:Ig-like domain-containing protein n=1 Tax=Seriola dumerili TaxID=41447 RepID=A0A3B4UFD8_SERDU
SAPETNQYSFFPPSSAELQSNKATLLCLSSQSVPFAQITWLVGGSPVSNHTFQISSYLDIQTSDWNMEKLYTCKVSLGSQTSEKNINKSACPLNKAEEQNEHLQPASLLFVLFAH